MQLQKAPNTTAIINNKEYLFFSGTSYLGIPMLPQFQEIVTQSILKWGTSYGSSRSANLKLSVYQKGENYLSAFLNTNDAVTVSSGTLAGQFALRSLQKKVDAFFYMPKTHPSILIDEAKPIFENDELNSNLKNAQNKSICILVDAIAALETTPFSFAFLNEISSTNTLFILLDESHSLGVLGANGTGISSQIPKAKNREVIIVSSLGKAFGINGGVIAGSTAFINLVKTDSLFIGCAGMNPSFLEAFVNGAEIYQHQLKKLRENCSYVYHKVNHLKAVRMSENYPVFFFGNEEIADYLYKKGILITSFYYPASTKKINRIVLNANHTQKQLDFLIDCIIQF
ncbi:8-amino-7-oxononanoate synthase [Polaribacter huanghezhanensis]|uniref:aminotransferase class I/II-fold pyridoxal phosphate-dependent enzyme n=1 Tax=Polaribacter huanghezhanensis TaxID=1354726 RepID=UPI002648EA7B|nr:aminotransferase class I/II-fold pyridoxal phosphate-dependent enzyme [Polaribacter huanghezhanensis]WKD85379.1 8-amino-7-oxononanoate synthase [Polaribacter huanghezhanensis]